MWTCGIVHAKCYWRWERFCCCWEGGPMPPLWRCFHKHTTNNLFGTVFLTWGWHTNNKERLCYNSSVNLYMWWLILLSVHSQLALFFSLHHNGTEDVGSCSLSSARVDLCISQVYWSFSGYCHGRFCIIYWPSCQFEAFILRMSAMPACAPLNRARRWQTNISKWLSRRILVVFWCWTRG